jgi:hypothetical protein
VDELRVVADKRVRVGASVHSLESARRRGARGGLVFFGPVYDTPSKRAYGAPQGLARWRACRPRWQSRSSRSAASRPIAFADVRRARCPLGGGRSPRPFRRAIRR